MIAYDNLVSYGLPQKKSTRTQRGSSEEEEFNNNGGIHINLSLDSLAIRSFTITKQ